MAKEKQEKLKLNLGCGLDIRDDYLNVDLVKYAGVDLFWDCGDIKDYIEDGAAEKILANDILEHFPIARIPAVLDEWVRMLAPGGEIEIRIPDMEWICKRIIEDPQSPEIMIQHIYGAQDQRFVFHKSGFTKAYLTMLLEERGLKIWEIREEPPNFVIEAIK